MKIITLTENECHGSGGRRLTKFSVNVAQLETFHDVKNYPMIQRGDDEGKSVVRMYSGKAYAVSESRAQITALIKE